MTARTPVAQNGKQIPTNGIESQDFNTTNNDNRPSSALNLQINQSSENNDRNTGIGKKDNAISYSRGHSGGNKEGRTVVESREGSRNNGEDNSKAYTEVRGDLEAANNKAAAADSKLEALDEHWREYPQRTNAVETKMARNGYNLEELEWRNKLHSAKIHALEKELKHVRLENDAIKGRFAGNTPNGYKELDYNRGDPYEGRFQDPKFQREGDPYRVDRYQEQNPYQEESPRVPPPQRRAMPENEQHRVAHRRGGADEEAYWGFNKYYNPQFVTAYRREHVPYYIRQEEQGQQPPGGLYIIRFHDVGYDDVNLTLREQQTIVKSSGGYVLGIARKHNVIVIDGDQEWTFSRQQTPRHHVTIPHRVVDDALAVLWFPNRDKAFDFFSNSFRNRFRQQGFPHPSGYWEGHFVPLLTPPFLKTLDTYLVLELPNAARYRQEDLQQFEAEARQAVLKVMPDSLPFVASALRGREAFKPGSLFKTKSKVFLSRFNSMSEVAEAWKTGVIQSAMQRYGISGPMNVSAFSLKDWID